jgi:hypothetical protein
MGTLVQGKPSGHDISPHEMRLPPTKVSLSAPVAHGATVDTSRPLISHQMNHTVPTATNRAESGHVRQANTPLRALRIARKVDPCRQLRSDRQRPHARLLGPEFLWYPRFRSVSVVAPVL